MIKKEYLSFSEIKKTYKIKSNDIKKLCARGVVSINKNMVLKKDVELIVRQNETYISLKKFLVEYCGRDDFTYANNREKYYDFLVKNDFFDVQILYPNDLKYMLEKDSYYINKSDIEFLKDRTEKFFWNFGKTQKALIDEIIEKMPSKEKILIKNFLDNDTSKVTESTTQFVDIISRKCFEDVTIKDIEDMYDEAETKKTISYIERYYSSIYDAGYNVKYQKLKLKEKERQADEAYTDNQIIEWAKLVFPKGEKLDKLVQKAFDNYFYAEIWLFNALLYTCSWRRMDIVTKWEYLDLKNNSLFRKLLPDTNRIKELIQNDEINDDIYYRVTNYCLSKLIIKHKKPSKTGMKALGELRSAITEDLKPLFGKIILIAEYHHLYDEEKGYMNPKRADLYLNWLKISEFFGDKYLDVFGDNNLKSRRMNKSIMQGIELSGKKLGLTPLKSSMIASLSRNHKNLNTTILYLKDHNLTGENLDLIVSMLQSRGVIGVYLYEVLKMVFPDEFNRLSENKKTELMNDFKGTPLQLEYYFDIQLIKEQLIDSFSSGEVDIPTKTLIAMYNIGNGYARGKDEGVHCLPRAFRQGCQHPRYDSCLADCCPYLILTTIGIDSLIMVIKDYEERSQIDTKYKAVLEKIIIPNFQSIINSLTKYMTKEEKDLLKKYIVKELNDGARSKTRAGR